MSDLAERRQEEKEQRREDILDAAERVFQRQGVDNVTMGAIAKEARVSRSLIYVYFTDKADIELAVAQRSIDLLHQLFEGAIQRHTHGIDKIRAIGEAYITFFRTRPFHYEMFVRQEAIDVGGDEGEATPAQRAYQHRGLQVMELMADAVQVGMDDGTIRSDVGSPMKTAVTLWGMTHGVLQIAAIKERMLIEQFRLSIDELAGHAIEMAGRAMDPAR